MNKKIVLFTPPFTQLNTPYPATAYLLSSFKCRQEQVVQYDLSIELFLALFSSNGLTALFDLAFTKVIDENRISLDRKSYKNINTILGNRKRYLATIDTVIAFLQGKRQTMATLLTADDFLPRAARFKKLLPDDMDWNFGTLGIRDKAIHFCTLYLEDLGDLITTVIDPHFGFSRYAERLGRCASYFDEIENYLATPLTLIEELMIDLLAKRIQEEQPDVVGFSIPFPGNLVAALRCGAWIKQHYPDVRIVFGGGFPNTELRSLSDRRLFAYTDYLLLDDGEAPLHRLMDFIEGTHSEEKLMRTFALKQGKVHYFNNENATDLSQEECGYPDYRGIDFSRYITTCDVLNPMHRLWSDGHWNKLTLAHGCYWGKCAFCDGSLDYIQRFQPCSASVIVDRMEQIIAETGEYGFHFVDEAAPPVLLRHVAEELIRRQLPITWWGNIRFEKSYTFELCQLLKRSGCIAVSGGLEVASDRLLKLINKGVDLCQVARVANDFTANGIMVHAYLMYGFPSQTIQETVDSLEVVRQLFQLGIVQSGFWHQFALTAHSPVGVNPEAFGIEITQPSFGGFAMNDISFIDSTGIDHNRFSEGLRISLFNYMRGSGFDLPLQQWFSFKIPRTTIPSNYIAKLIKVG